MTDHVFRQPAIRLAEAQLPHAPRVSMYRFDLPSTAMDGALGAVAVLVGMVVQVVAVNRGDR